ncbi:MAG: 4-phosphopantetheinyl transferase family protein [Leptospiraceae bacterium]|nr:4-phosphopantetheinyl transferase family protein [Leptospiraceae bacterium]
MKRAYVSCVGNDVVDLSDPESDDILQNRKVLLRVLNPEELAMVENSPDPRKTYWAIWAAKESAFKALSSFFRNICFIPKKFRVSQDFSEVRFRTLRLALRVEKNNSFIHALCAFRKNELEKISFCVRPKSYLLENFAREAGASPRQSNLVRILLKKECHKLFHPVDAAQVQLRESDCHRAPQVKIIHATGETEIPVSLSHHGEFFATAILLPSEVIV